MAFRKRRSPSSGDMINLIPMLDVLMTVLTFFIIVSMTLALDRGVNTNLASRSGNANAPAVAPMVIKLSLDGIVVNDQPVSQPEISSQVKRYLSENPDGKAMLQAAPNVSYEQAVQLLGELKSIGGDRVLLAIE
jgi:biopolymer transport protein ExbD